MIKLPEVFVLTTLVMLTACTPMASIRPLVEDNEAAAVDSAYLGVWKDCNGSEHPDIYNVEKSRDVVYRYRNLTSADDAGELRLIKLDGTVFADIRPNGGVVPGHILAKVRLDGDRLFLAFLQEDEARKALPHEQVGAGDNKQVVLTAVTSQLRRYLQKAPPAAFQEEAPLCRVQ